MGLGFVPVRKPGKLPSTTVRVEYELEYGTDALEMHDDAVQKGQRVLVVDDLLATGGTAKAVVELLTGRGAEVHALAFLNSGPTESRNAPTVRNSSSDNSNISSRIRRQRNGIGSPSV